MIEERAESLLTGDFRSDEVFWSNMRCGKVNRSSKISKMHLYMDLYIVRILYLAGVTTRYASAKYSRTALQSRNQRRLPNKKEHTSPAIATYTSYHNNISAPCAIVPPQQHHVCNIYYYSNSHVTKHDYYVLDCAHALRTHLQEVPAANTNNTRGQ